MKGVGLLAGLLLVGCGLALGRPAVAELSAAEVIAEMETREQLGVITVGSEAIGEYYDLARCISTALDYNLNIQSARARIERQRGVTLTARAVLLPKLNVVGDYERIDANRLPSMGDVTFGNDRYWRTEVQLVQPLYTGGRGTAQRRQADYLEQAAALELDTVIALVILTVQERFFDALLAQEQVKVRRQAVELLEGELRLERERLRAGTVSDFNVLRAEVELANAQTPFIRARNDLRLSLEELARVLGLPLEDPGQVHFFVRIKGELESRPLDLDLPVALQAAYRQRPELQRVELLLAAQQEGVRVEQAGYWPEIQAYGGYGLEGSRFSEEDETQRGWVAGVRGTWRIFDGWATKGRVAQSRAEAAIVTIDRQRLRRDIDFEVRQALSRLVEAQELVAAAQKVVAQGEESFRLARARLASGAARQIDLLDTQVALTQARTNKVEALHAFNTAQARYEWAVGGRVADPPVR